MARTYPIAVALGLAVAAALALRLPALGRRPMHPDESVQAVKTGALMETGQYRYDPHECHGPTLYYFGAASAWLRSGGTFADATAASLRVAVALFGAALVLVLWWVRDGLGGPAVVVAGALTAVSPAFVYYSRFYMQEPLLVFFTAAAIATGWRYTQTRHWGWAVVGGACLGLMHATKETCIIAYAAMAGALALTLAWRRWLEHEPIRLRPWLSWKAVAAGCGAGIVASALFFTSFLTHPAGLVDSVTTYAHYLDRAASGGEHSHPWHYYLHMLLGWRCGSGPVWTEALIVVLAAVGGAIALRRRGKPLVRFIAFYTLLMVGVYSAIPYKTPWCMLGFLHGMILLAGAGAAAIVRAVPRARQRALVWLLLAAGAGHLAWQAQRASFAYCADVRNPYAYSQTSADLPRLAARVEQLARTHPDGHRMLVKVVAAPSNYWPLPWYLRRFERVGYWSEPPDDADAAVVITSADLAPALEAKLHGTYQTEHFGLRPGVLLVAYIERGLWDAFVQRGAALHRFSHDAMATTFQIIVAGRKRAYAQQAAAAAFETVDRLEAELSRFVATSDVSQINALDRGESVRVGAAAFECLQLAARVSADTAGAFDVTVGSLLDGKRAGPVGMNLLALDEVTHAVGLRADGVRVDLGGIAKGYAVDRMVDVLRDWGIEAALVHSGQSTVFALGSPPGQAAWSVALRDPVTQTATLGTLRLRDRALSGSGMKLHGRHIIDPRTKRPAAGKLATWALAPTAALSDALSTAFMVMSVDAVRVYCAAHADVAAQLELERANALVRFGRVAE